MGEGEPSQYLIIIRENQLKFQAFVVALAAKGWRRWSFVIRAS